MRAALCSFIVASLLGVLSSTSRAGGVAASLDVASVRGQCEIALEREQRHDSGVSSRELCHKAFLQGETAEDLHNEAVSMLAPDANPSLDDLAVVTLFGEAATRKAPREPWGYLVRCEIARRLGSVDGLDACRADLRRFAPTHPAAQRELARAVVSTPLVVWLGRWLVLLALTGTLAYAMSRRRRWRAGRRRVGAGLSVVALACLVSAPWARPALAIETRDSLSSIPIDDANPEASIPSLEAQQHYPLEFGYLLQDLLARAADAWKKGDHARAARYYKALTLAAPNAAYGPGKWCEELETLGDFTQAIVACRTAITRSGSTAGDYARFVNVVLKSDKPLPPREHEEIDNVLTHLDEEGQKDGQELGVLPAQLRCEVGARYHDVPELEACTARLVKVAPNDKKTILFQWTLALERHDAAAAETFIDQARHAGMPPEGLTRMEKATSDLGRRRMGRFLVAGLAVVMLVLAARSGLRWLATRRLASNV